MAKIERPQAMVMSEVAWSAKSASFSSFPVTTYIEFAFHNKLFVKRRMAWEKTFAENGWHTYTSSHALPDKRTHESNIWYIAKDNKCSIHEMNTRIYTSYEYTHESSIWYIAIDSKGSILLIEVTLEPQIAADIVCI